MDILSGEAEYANNPNIKKDDIDQLAEWLKKQNHLPEISEHVLILFYRCCDYSLQQAKDLINYHYKYRNEAVELFNGKDYEAPRYSEMFFDISYFADMKSCTSNGYRLIYTGLKDYNPDKWNFKVSLNMVIRTLFTIELEQGSCPGYVFIFNLTGLTSGHLNKMNLQLMRKFMTYIQEGTPLKVQEVHIIHASSIISKILFIIRPLIKKQLFDLIRIHSDMESFYKEIPKEILPEDLGGTQPVSVDVLNEQSRERVYAHWKVVSEEIALRADKSKYKDESQNGTAMSGSFKKLCFD